MPFARLCLLAMTAAACVAADPATAGVRIKDLAEVYGVRDNQLYGVGLVVGLSGSGDKQAATLRVTRQMLSRFRMSFNSESELSAKNIALVAVTADLPAFSRKGARLRTSIACLGDATSLKGGTLMQTLLVGHDGAVYAAAQGAVSIGGHGAAGPAVAQVGAGTEHKVIETAGLLTPGALVEQELPQRLLVGDRLRLVLRQPDFTTASRLAEVLGAAFAGQQVVAEDNTVVSLRFAPGTSEPAVVEALAKLQQLRVVPDARARVVVNSRTGTVVAGNQVRVAPVALSHGGLSLRVQPREVPLRGDPTRSEQVWTDPATRLSSASAPAGVRPAAVPGTFTVMDGSSVEDIAGALNAIGARPRDLVAIFESLERVGALHAELVVE